VHAASANRTPARSCTRLLAAPVLLLLTSAAHAAEPNCTADPTTFPCRMIGLLHWLEATAWVLAIIFVVVLAIAIHLYRKNRPGPTERR
jgi:hypothetical protein